MLASPRQTARMMRRIALFAANVGDSFASSLLLHDTAQTSVAQTCALQALGLTFPPLVLIPPTNPAAGRPSEHNFVTISLSILDKYPEKVYNTVVWLSIVHQEEDVT